MQALYTATATAVGGRAGSIKSSDGVLDLQLAYPKELGGPGGAANEPGAAVRGRVRGLLRERTHARCTGAQSTSSRIERHSSCVNRSK